MWVQSFRKVCCRHLFPAGSLSCPLVGALWWPAAGVEVSTKHQHHESAQSICFTECGQNKPQTSFSEVEMFFVTVLHSVTQIMPFPCHVCDVVTSFRKLTMTPVAEYAKKCSGFSWRPRASYWSAPKPHTPSFLPSDAVMCCRCICRGPWPVIWGTCLLPSHVCTHFHMMECLLFSHLMGKNIRDLGWGAARSRPRVDVLFLHVRHC